MQDAVSSPPDSIAACSNCGSARVARYCADCGQDQANPVRSIKPWADDFFDSAFNLDSRLWRTLKPLMLEPGRLTADYVSGRRARHVPPLKLYVFVSLAFFLLAALIKDPGTAIVIDPPKAAESSSPAAHGQAVGDPLQALPGTLRAQIEAGVHKLKLDPAGFGRALFEHYPATLFLFVPVVALVLKLLYLRSRHYYVEHLVLCLHNHSFAFLALLGGLMLGQLLRLFPGQATTLSFAEFLLVLYTGAYLWLAMRRVYAQSPAVTTIKFLALLSIGYGVLLAGALILVVLYTLYQF